MEKIAPAVNNRDTQLELGTVAEELTQAKRRMQRAVWSESLRLRMKLTAEGKDVMAGLLASPLTKELTRIEDAILDLQLAFGIEDEEQS